MVEFVSCILATGDRPAFLRQAIRCFLRQTYDYSELIVVDDGEKSASELCAGLCRVHYIRLKEPAPLGQKLNIGIQHSKGTVIQKLDDDDFYHPEFLEHAVSSLKDKDRENSVTAWDCFLILLKGEIHARYSGHGWSAGGTLCFHREFWNQKKFQEVHRAVDYLFIRDHQPQIVKVCAPEFYILIRHGHNTWNFLGKEKVEEYFQRRPIYHKPLEHLVEPIDLTFYQSLARGDSQL